jgi:hypothetical protein
MARGITITIMATIMGMRVMTTMTTMDTTMPR